MAVTDHESCSPMARSHAIGQLAALICTATAELLDVIVAAERKEDFRDDGAFEMEAWLVAALNVSRTTARAWVRVGRSLVTLPELRARFAGGELSWDQVAAATWFATPETDGMLARQLPGCTAAEIEDMARERTRRTRRDAERSHDERRFGWTADHDRDGFRYHGFLPAAEGAIVNAALTREAESVGADAETNVWAPFAQRCADALVEQGRRAIAVDPGPDPHLVVVHVDAEVLTGTLEGNGSLEGIQLPVTTVQRLLCDSPVECNVEGPDGTCIGVGRAQHSPPRWLRRRILRRDHDLCRFPGCGRKIRQVHHIRWWTRDHGPTDSWNLVGFCWGHHHLVHEGGWTIEGNADHELTFTSPLGRELRSKPTPLRGDVRRRILGATGDSPSAA